MRFPWVNVALLILLLLQLASGYLGFVNGEERQAWLLWLHGMGAYALALLLWWKGSVVWNVLRRRKRWTWARVSFVVSIFLLLLTLALGLSWTFGVPYGAPRYLFGFSLVSLHIYIAVPLTLFLAFHVWRMRWILDVDQAVDRRAFLRLGLAGLAGAAAWWLLRRLQGRRRFTGSYEIGSMGGHFPHVSWIDDNPAPLNPASWRLSLDGAVRLPQLLSYETLLQMAAEEQTAIVDCTGGWYSEQVWRGVPMRDLLAQAGVRAGDAPGSARSVLVRSVTGYWRRFSLAEAQQFLLATHVAGAPLDHGHGFPTRLVAPGLRGFEWVKWVTAIRVENVSPWLQPPLPLQ